MPEGSDWRNNRNCAQRAAAEREIADLTEGACSERKDAFGGRSLMRMGK